MAETEWNDVAFERALEQAAEGIIDAPGVRLSGRQLALLLEAAPRDPPDPQQRRRLKSVDFREATITGTASFSNATFSAKADFKKVQFTDGAAFINTTFETVDFREARFPIASFLNATFNRGADFGGATFGEDEALFTGAKFIGLTSFTIAKFTGVAMFNGATFSRGADSSGATFTGASFSRDADFTGVSFRGNAKFDDATFGAKADFNRVTFSRDAHFDRAKFEVATEFGQFDASDRLSLDEAVFLQRVKIKATALCASFTGAEFRRGADIRLLSAEVWLDDTDFAEASLFAALPAQVIPEGGKEDAAPGAEMPADVKTRSRMSGEPAGKFGPRVLSLRGSRLASLTLSEVDLRECRFADAHGLDDLRLERVEFPRPPDGWQWVRGWPMRWTRRRTIAEEHHWRGWDQGRPPTASPHPRPPERPPDLGPDQIAGLYRQLRKGREDRRDEPGANDFYYGEMEMRRRSGPVAEGSILWVYWLVSGYGLRASRALLALAITIAVLGAIPLARWGFRPAPPYGRALLFALQSSISLLRAPASPPGHETAGGQVIEIFLRLAGPLFFGLALLALRGRVKR